MTHWSNLGWNSEPVGQTLMEPEPSRHSVYMAQLSGFGISTNCPLGHDAGVGRARTSPVKKERHTSIEKRAAAIKNFII